MNEYTILREQRNKKMLMLWSLLLHYLNRNATKDELRHCHHALSSFCTTKIKKNHDIKSPSQKKNENLLM
jgi:hypothetical protein